MKEEAKEIARADTNEDRQVLSVAAAASQSSADLSVPVEVQDDFYYVSQQQEAQQK